MGQFNHGAFVTALRKRRGSIPADLYADLMAALEAGLAVNQAGQSAPTGEPDWLAVARQHMGLKEIPGTSHEGKIVGFFKAAMAGWFSDDETPWCGAFVAWCMIQAGLPIPANGKAVRALAWATWGQESPPRVGAVAVFGRKGGGHVGFAVGESATHIYVLGGNQSDQVNIMPIAKTRLVALRWPAGVQVPLVGKLPTMSGGTVSTNEI